MVAAYRRLATTNDRKFQELAGKLGNRRSYTDDDFDDLFIAALQSWVWPDTSSDEDGNIVRLGDPTYDLFTYREETVSQLDLAGRRPLVRGGRLPAGADQARAGVWVIPNDSYINNQMDHDDLRERVVSTILGFDLNRFDPTSLDRRVENRTLALPVVRRSLESLKDVVRSTPRDGPDRDSDLDHVNVEVFAGALRETIRATGFWTMWAQEFQKGIMSAADDVWRNYTAPARQRLLYRIFVQYEEDNRTLFNRQAYRPTKDSPIPRDVPKDEIVFQMVLAGTDPERLDF